MVEAGEVFGLPISHQQNFTSNKVEIKAAHPWTLFKCAIMRWTLCGYVGLSPPPPLSVFKSSVLKELIAAVAA